MVGGQLCNGDTCVHTSLCRDTQIPRVVMNLSYVTVVWSMQAAAALLMGIVYFLVWARDRSARASLALSIVALSIAGGAFAELMAMQSLSLQAPKRGCPPGLGQSAQLRACDPSSPASRIFLCNGRLRFNCTSCLARFPFIAPLLQLFWAQALDVAVVELPFR